MEFLVLFVCTGNICRSPVAELLFAQQVAGLPILVASAGTSGLSGHEMDGPSAFAMREMGFDPRAHVARRLTPAMVTKADLVLTADASHRSIVVQGEPLAFRRTFTMREFGRLGASLGDTEIRANRGALVARVAAVAGKRGWVEAAESGADDIADPFGGGIDVARATVHELGTAVDSIVAALGIVTRDGLGARPSSGRGSALA